MSPTGTSRMRSSRSPMPASSSPPVAVRAEMCDVGHQAAEQHAEERQQALDDEHRHGGEHHPDAEARRERHRGEPVEHRLQGQLVDAAAEAVVERAEDGQRADAEQQGCREPPLDEPFPRGGVGAALGGPPPGHPGLDPAGQPLEPLLDRSAEPVIDPMSSDPSTMSMGKPAPTASRSAGSVTATADSPATSRVTSPSSR